MEKNKTTMVYSNGEGDPGFDELIFGNERVVESWNPAHIGATVYFNHMYRSTYDLTSKGTHSCLYFGYWCWPNLREHPTQLLRYIKCKGKGVISWLTMPM